jgi:hypothetical protein
LTARLAPSSPALSSAPALSAEVPPKTLDNLPALFC